MILRVPTMKRAATLLVLTLGLASWTGVAQVPARQELSGERSRLHIAASQHEIIAILLNERQYDLVVGEFAKIVELGFTGDQERLLVEETWLVADQLRQAGQYQTGLEVIDLSLHNTSLPESQFALLMLKGKVLKDSGRIEEALSAYRRAQRVRE